MNVGRRQKGLNQPSERRKEGAAKGALMAVVGLYSVGRASAQHPECAHTVTKRDAVLHLRHEDLLALSHARALLRALCRPGHRE